MVALVISKLPWPLPVCIPRDTCVASDHHTCNSSGSLTSSKNNEHLYSVFVLKGRNLQSSTGNGMNLIGEAMAMAAYSSLRAPPAGLTARSSSLLHSAAQGGPREVTMAIAKGSSTVEYRTPQGVRLKESKAMMPEEYVWPEGRAPRLAHDEYGECEIPVIDMGGMMAMEMEKTRRVAVVEEVRKACQEWGFFQIVNHGFSTDMLARVERESRRLFSLPLEEKLKSQRQPGTVSGYGHGSGIHVNTKPWSECFGMRPVPGPLVSDHAEKLFQGEARQEFRECFEEYEASMSELAKAMVGVMCEGLGIAGNHFDQYRKTNDCLIRLNYYAPCPEPLQTIGLGEHSDPNILTLLHQGNIGGLQVMKDGQWIAVRPQSNAFVVNVGDCLQAVSNGIYRSLRHRAVVNKTQTRLSHAYFFLPDKDQPLCPAAELVTAERPALYRPFSLTDLLKQKLSNTDYGEDTIDHFLIHSQQKP